MRKLLNTLYVMTDSCYLTLDGENIVIQDGEKTLGRFPLHTLENIICFTYKGASPALMGACAERNIGLSFSRHEVHFWHELSERNMEMYYCERSNIAYQMMITEVLLMRRT